MRCLNLLWSTHLVKTLSNSLRVKVNKRMHLYDLIRLREAYQHQFPTWIHNKSKCCERIQFELIKSSWQLISSNLNSAQLSMLFDLRSRTTKTYFNYWAMTDRLELKAIQKALLLLLLLTMALMVLYSHDGVWGVGASIKAATQRQRQKQPNNKTVNNNYQNVDQRWARVQCIIDSSINVIARLQHSKERQGVEGGRGGSEGRRPLCVCGRLCGWFSISYAPLDAAQYRWERHFID